VATYLDAVSTTAREWLERQRASHAQPEEGELARIRSMTPDERWALMGERCRAHMAAVQALPEPLRGEVLAYRDPLPPSSETALRRLRAEYAAQRP
jgi:hypothetical protein